MVVHPVLSDKVALGAGAAMGMGEATPGLFAEAGAKVVLADMNPDLGAAVAAGSVAKGGTATFVAVNISDSAQVAALVERAVARYGPLDVAVNNAAIRPTTGRWRTLTRSTETG